MNFLIEILFAIQNPKWTNTTVILVIVRRPLIRSSAGVRNFMRRVLILNPPWIGMVTHLATIYETKKKL